MLVIFSPRIQEIESPGSRMDSNTINYSEHTVSFGHFFRVLEKYREVQHMSSKSLL